MKRFTCSESLAALVSLCPSSEHEKWSEGICTSKAEVNDTQLKTSIDGREDEEYCIEESGQTAEKKRRLSSSQVKALDKNFEIENKLEPERKVKLAQELGLQPRQVAIWFQNRRARWKAKQLEKDYTVLKARYEALELNCDALHHDKKALLAEIGKLKVKLQVQGEDKNDNNSNLKIEDESQEIAFSASQNKGSEEKETNQKQALPGEFKDTSSQSDCSVILCNENNPNASDLTGTLRREHQEMVILSPFASSFAFECSNSMASSTSCLPCEISNSNSSLDLTALENTQEASNHNLKMEEQKFLIAEEPCNFHLDEHGLFSSWYSPEQWI